MTLLEFCNTYPEMRVVFCYDTIYKSMDVTFDDSLFGFHHRELGLIPSEENIERLLFQVELKYLSALDDRTPKRKSRIRKGSVKRCV